MIDLKTKRIVVTGGAGFLGSRIVTRLQIAGAEVYAPRRAVLDLTQLESIDLLFQTYKPDILIHAAAAVGGIGANALNPGRFFYENALMGIQLIEACRRYAVEKVVIIGTVCSYPYSTVPPFIEELLWVGYPEATNAPYGIAKRMLLTQLQAYRAQYGMNGIYLIPANLYGPGDNFDLDTSHVIPAIIRKCVEAAALGASEVRLWGDGTPTREFLYVEDAAKAIVLATERYGGAEPVNIGVGEDLPIERLADKIAFFTGFKGHFVWEPSKPNGQPRRRLDVTRAAREFGFCAATRLDAGLQLTIDWYRAHVL